MVEEMKIKDGYKKTEVGIIPEDWEVKKLGDILKVKHGKTQHLVENRYGEYPILGTGGQIGRSIKALYNQPSVLIGRKGTIDKPQYVDNPFWTIDTLFYTEINKKNSVKYIYYLFNTIDWYSYNEASGVPSLNAKVIENISIKIPPLKEQKSIATVLSDMDDLIESTQKLIDKKKKMKQGTIQELLTGKKRLDGFSAEWITKNLEKLFNFKQGVQCSVLKQRVLKEEGLVRFIRIVDLTKNDELPRYIKDPGLEHHVSNDDLFMIRYGEPGIVGYDFEGVIANNLFHLNPKIVIYNKFFYYLLTYMKKEIAQLSSSTTMAALNFESLKLLNIKTPKDIKEQKAIAQILSDMDSEIELQQQKLEKYKTIKKGMMQELLTGRIRLI